MGKNNYIQMKLENIRKKLWEECSSCVEKEDVDNMSKIQSKLKKFSELEEKYKLICNEINDFYDEINTNGYRDIDIFISYGSWKYNYILMDEAIKKELVPMNKEIKIKVNGLSEDTTIEATLTENKKRINTNLIEKLKLNNGDHIILKEIKPNELYEITPVYSNKIKADREAVIKRKYRTSICNMCKNTMEIKFVNEYKSYIEKIYKCENGHCQTEKVNREEPKCPNCGGDAYVYSIDIDSGVEKCVCRNNVNKNCNSSFDKII